MKSGEVTRDLPLCSCGERPVLIWHYIKGRANVINYLVKCEYCRKRTRNRKHGADAVKEWEIMNIKQTNLEWLNSLISSEQRVREFDLQYAEYRNLPSGDNYNAVNKILIWLSMEHVEPITLTPEERKAAQLLIDCGNNFVKIIRLDSVYVCKEHCNGVGNWNRISAIPNASILCKSAWITSEPIDLRTLL